TPEREVAVGEVVDALSGRRGRRARREPHAPNAGAGGKRLARDRRIGIDGGGRRSTGTARGLTGGRRGALALGGPADEHDEERGDRRAYNGIFHETLRLVTGSNQHPRAPDARPVRRSYGFIPIFPFGRVQAVSRSNMPVLLSYVSRLSW